MKKLLMLIIALALQQSVFAQAYVSPPGFTKVIRVNTYHYGNIEGDISIIVSPAIPGCESGFS